VGFVAKSSFRISSASFSSRSAAISFHTKFEQLSEKIAEGQPLLATKRLKTLKNIFDDKFKSNSTWTALVIK